MVKIAPSILSADFCRLEDDIKKVSSADWLPPVTVSKTYWRIDDEEASRNG